MSRRGNRHVGCHCNRQGRKRLLLIALLLVLLAGGLLLRGQVQPEAGQIKVLQVDEETVYANEAMIYWKLMQTEFEKMGTESIWDLTMIGADPQQTAMDRVMESIIRVKTMQSLAGSLRSREEQELAGRAQELADRLGQDYMNQHDIDEALLLQVLRENYKAYRYESNAKFLAGSNEEEIERQLEETFGVYELLDQDVYLQSAMIMPMMFYTGQWVEEEWVSYSDAQKALILEDAEKLKDRLTAKNFKDMAQRQSDDGSLENNPVFDEGCVQHKLESYGYVYRGQIQADTAAAIFSTKPGQITDIIETEYGYLIVKVIHYQPANDSDKQFYASQLEAARETYRGELMEELRKQRLEEEWQRLEEESDIQRWDERWQEYLLSAEP